MIKKYLLTKASPQILALFLLGEIGRYYRYYVYTRAYFLIILEYRIKLAQLARMILIEIVAAAAAASMGMKFMRGSVDIVVIRK